MSVLACRLLGVSLALLLFLGDIAGCVKDGWVLRAQLAQQLLAGNSGSNNGLSVPNLLKHARLHDRIDLDRKDFLQNVVAERVRGQVFHNKLQSFNRVRLKTENANQGLVFSLVFTLEEQLDVIVALLGLEALFDNIA